MDSNAKSTRILGMFSFFILIFCISGIYAYEIPINFTKGNLDATISSQLNLAFNESPSMIPIDVRINNPSSDELQIYFAERTDSTWKILSDLGNVSPGTSLNRSFNIRFEYSGATTQTGDFAIISDKLTVKTFKITENWSAYEQKTSSVLFFVGFVVAPIIGLVLVFILYLISRESSRRIEARKEYGEKIIGWSECNSFEKVVFILSKPLVWLVFGVIVFSLMSYLVLVAHPGIEPMTILQISIVSLVAGIFIPIILVLLVWYGDIYEREPISYIGAMFIWGVIAALLAFFINPVIISLFNISPDNVPLVLLVVFGSVIVSPIVEEALKGIGVYIMSCHREMNNTLDGLLYGFAVGVGFAAVENWFYFISKMDPLAIGIDAWLLSILYRSFFNTIAHGCFTAFIGAMIGMMKGRSRVAGYSYLGLLPGLFIAIILHMIFNISAFLDVVAVSTFRMVILFFNPLLVITVGIGFAIIYYFGVLESKKTPIG